MKKSVSLVNIGVIVFPKGEAACVFIVSCPSACGVNVLGRSSGPPPRAKRQRRDQRSG